MDNSEMQLVWSNQRSEFTRVDDELRCGSRRLALLQSFLQHKFREEFESFVEGYDVSGVNVNVFSDIPLPTSTSANPPTEVVRNEERACCSTSSAAPPPRSVSVSVEGVAPNDTSASSSFSPEADSNDVESRQSEETSRSVEPHCNDSQFDRECPQIISAGPEEVAPFIEGFVVSDVFLIFDALPPASLWNPPPANGEMNGNFESTTAAAPPSVDFDSVNFDGVVVNQPVATSPSSLRIPSAELETTDIETPQFEETGRSSEELVDTDDVVENSTSSIPSEVFVSVDERFKVPPTPLGDTSNSETGHPVRQQTSTASHSNSPPGETSTTSRRAVPSPLPSSSVRRSLRKKKKPVDEDWQRKLSNLLCPMKLHVSLKRLSDATEQGNCKIGYQKESDGNKKVSLASGGEHVDSRPTESCEQPMRGKRKKSDPSKHLSSFQCSTCKKCYSSKWTLKTHKQTHNPDKKFKCLFCPTSFHQKPNLQRHQLTHTNEKPFRCSFCAKNFSRSAHLSDHEMIHTNEKPLKCSRCPKIFRKTSTLRKHEKNDNIHPTVVRSSRKRSPSVASLPERVTH